MAYCMVSDVQAICDTDITAAEIDDLIDESSAWMDMKLNTGSINPLVLRMICRTHVAIRCMLKDPNSQALGEYREDREFALKKLNSFLDEMVKGAAAEASGGIGFQYSYARIRT